MNVIVAQGASVFELLAREDEALLVGWDAFFVLDFRLDIVYCVAGFDLEGDGLAREGLDETDGAQTVVSQIDGIAGSQSISLFGGWRFLHLH